MQADCVSRNTLVFSLDADWSEVCRRLAGHMEAPHEQGEGRIPSGFGYWQLLMFLWL